MTDDPPEGTMRQPRRGAPFGWLLALLLPLLVSGGLGPGAASALLHAPSVAKASGEHHPFSRQAHAGDRFHLFAPGLAGTGGSGGGHPVAAVPPGSRHLPPPAGSGTGPARDDGPRPLAALLVRPGRAPPSTGA
ncbi:hypothetical protein HS041_01215 [Planomonospora sp. ID67723]|uniref:hypothetical protein n=1 Tax=Planomonospora sp. ID67723 TaxID=2738134 RepID=UPI0018C3F85B|nr:hypothetical protein [Planomonospora sp. ID67723]MBG0826401.1 hypothetical protein [Planomonospora sp. ID67723]